MGGVDNAGLIGNADIHPVIRQTARLTYTTARRIAIAAIGSSVLVIGILLLFLPGPAVVVIPIGLAILSVEFAWARMWLHKIRQKLSQNAIDSVGRRGSKYY